ncbi:hypothetical protein [Aquiflexum sp.]|uniref:hypothetical protein n=1 Tax=Aquiflexum sp. TaxID=1872584 RepID=UPI0035931E97
MIVERTEKEIEFKIPANTDIKELQRILDFLKYREATQDSQATEEIANKLADESKANWWKENKHIFSK